MQSACGDNICIIIPLPSQHFPGI